MTPKHLFGLSILAVAVLFKLWLITPFEITDDAADPSHYVEQILSTGGLCYGPGTGYVGKFFHQLGIPFREGIEVVYLGTCLLVVTALFESPTRSALALGLYLLAIFNPAPEELMSHLMSDQVWLVEVLAAFSLFILAMREEPTRRWFYFLFAGLCLGFSVITRSTFMPLMATLLGWGLIAALLGFSRGPRSRGAYLVPVGGLFILIYSTCFLYYSTCYFNSKYNGFSGISAFDSREYVHFYMSLQAVGEPDGPRYFPIDQARRNLIAQAGPRSAWMMAELDQDRQFKEVSLQTYGTYDLAPAWFHWAVFEMLSPDGNLKRPIAQFKEVEQEIAEANRSGKLKVRPIIPLPDCRWPIVLAAFPAAWRNVTEAMTYEPSRYAWAQESPQFTNRDFTQALSRRAVQSSPLREEIGEFLCRIYRPVYRILPAALIVAMAGFFILRARSSNPFAFTFLAQQILALFFVALFFWYALFDASGLLVVSRYMVFNNVLLPLLTAYYVRGIVELLRPVPLNQVNLDWGTIRDR